MREIHRQFFFHMHKNPLLAIDAILLLTLMFLPNVLICSNFLNAMNERHPLQGNWTEMFSVWLNHTQPYCLTLWALANLVLAALVMFLRRQVFAPMWTMIKHLRGAYHALNHETPSTTISLVSMRAMASDMARLTEIAQEYYIKHRATSEALVEARCVLQQITHQQRVILSSTSNEMVKQYQCVLAYANHLEDTIARKAAAPDLRYDFDEVSESSFKLKLIAGALNLIQQRYEPQIMRLDLPLLMEQTMLALAPSLDRRCMKLTTVEVDLGVHAQGDATIIAHVLWMMLLGTIRYAADESTMRLRCLYSRDRRRSLISIVISELSPNRLSEKERDAFMIHKLQHLTPHMFAETIRIHANLQLAEILLSMLDGQLSVLPLTSHSCEICLDLPAA